MKSCSIPTQDVDRVRLVGSDPVWNKKKHFIIVSNTEETIGYVWEGQIFVVDEKLNIQKPTFFSEDPIAKLTNIHSKLKFQGGSIRDEYDEQIMAVLYVRPNAKVLELGSNIGRNTLVIASLLNNPREQFVTIEIDPAAIKQLEINRSLNKMEFHIETCALSERPLFANQAHFWSSFPVGEIPDEFKSKVTERPVISWSSLQDKYKITFDTLVADCEGALYWILKDTPEILDHMQIIIMENDYNNILHKKELDEILLRKNFECVYTLPLVNIIVGACSDEFYQVWMKRNR